MIWRLLKQTAQRWYEDRISRLAASLAFYTVFSVAPIVLIAIAIAGRFFNGQQARQQIVGELQRLMGTAAGDAVDKVVDAARPGSESVLATVLGVMLLIYGATNVFAEMQDSMDTIWGVKPRPDLGWWQIIKVRILSFALVLGTGFLLLVSLVLSALLSAATRWLSGDEQMAWQVVNLAVSFMVTWALFTAIFKWLPDVRLRWRDVALGAAITSILFNVGKILIGFYLGRSSAASVYGAAGSLAVLLIWVYYAAQILFIGAAFTRVYTEERGRRAMPEPIAVRVTEEERARQGMPHQKRVEQAMRKKDAAAADDETAAE